MMMALSNLRGKSVVVKLVGPNPALQATVNSVEAAGFFFVSGRLVEEIQKMLPPSMKQPAVFVPMQQIAWVICSSEQEFAPEPQGFDDQSQNF